MARVKVKLADNIARVIFIEPDATIGADLGVDVRLNNAVATPAAVRAWLNVGEANATGGVQHHRLLQGLSLGDDHPQYPLRAENAEIGGSWNFQAPLRAADGTEALPVYTFALDLNTGIYRAGNDNLGIVVGGANKIDVAATIVTIDADLDVFNELGVFGELTAWDVIKTSSSGGVGEPSYGFYSDADTGMYRPTTDTVGFMTGGTERFRIGPLGQWGIGGANFGTLGQIYTSGGPSTAPSWQDFTGQPGIVFEDEGYALNIAGEIDTINFTGSGVVATVYGNILTVDISGGGSGLDFEDEGSPILTASTVNFVGSGVTVTDVGGVATVTIPGGGISGVIFKDEGSTIVTSATANFVGSGVTVTDVAGVATITVPGGISGVVFKDEGSTIVTAATANYVGAGVTVTDVAGVATVTIPGGISGVVFKDEGSTIVTASSVNYVGSGVTVTDVAGVATVTVPGGISGVVFKDEGSTIVTASTANFVGSGVTVTDVAGVATVTVPGGISGVAFQDEGGAIVTASTANFVGAGVTVTDVGGVATITIPGGGGSDVYLGAMQYVGGTTLGSNGTDITVSSLDLAAHESYFIQIVLKNVSGSTTNPSLFFNGDTTATNYHVELETGNNTTQAGARSNNANLGGFLTTENYYCEGWLVRDVDGNPRFRYHAHRGPGTAIINIDGSHIRNNTANVTSLTINSSVATAFGTGSYAKVWKLVTSAGAAEAEDIAFDNAASGLSATNVQDAIDELVLNPAVLGAMQYVGKATVAGAAATTLAFPTLNLDADGAYFFSIEVDNATASTTTISMYYNADTTAGNYDNEVIAATGTTVSAARANTAGYIVLTNGISGSIHGWIRRNVDGIVRAVGTMGRAATTATDLVTFNHAWRTASTNITGGLLSASVASSLAIGTTIRFWKLIDNANAAMATDIGFDDTGMIYDASTVQAALAASMTGGAYADNDESRASNAVLSDDPELFVNLPAGKFEIYLKMFFTTNVTADLKYDYNYTGTTVKLDAILDYGTYPSVPAGSVVAAGATAAGWMEGINSVRTFNFTSAVILAGVDKISIETSTAGVFSFRWAQNASNVGATVRKAGSSMTVVRIES